MSDPVLAPAADAQANCSESNTNAIVIQNEVGAEDVQAQTPEAAVTQFLEATYPKIKAEHVKEFKAKNKDAKTARSVYYGPDGRERAKAKARNYGKGWAVDVFAVCEDDAQAWAAGR